MPPGTRILAEDLKGFCAVVVQGETMCHVRRDTPAKRENAPLTRAWYGYKDGEKITDWHTDKESAARFALRALNRYQ